MRPIDATCSHVNQRSDHHRHYFDVVTPVAFTGYEEVEEQFQADWTALRSKA